MVIVCGGGCAVADSQKEVGCGTNKIGAVQRGHGKLPMIGHKTAFRAFLCPRPKELPSVSKRSLFYQHHQFTMETFVEKHDSLI